MFTSYGFIESEDVSHLVAEGVTKDGSTLFHLFILILYIVQLYKEDYVGFGPCFTEQLLQPSCANTAHNWGIFDSRRAGTRGRGGYIWKCRYKIKITLKYSPYFNIFGIYC